MTTATVIYMERIVIMDDFILRALLAGAAFATVAGVLGCFVVWRRMAYFGDSLAHSSLLGVALGLFLGIQTSLAAAIICITFSILLVWMRETKQLSMDTILGILAHTALAFGMVAISLLDGIRIDLHSYLFGDILTVSWSDIYTLAVIGVIIVPLVFMNWSKLILMTLHEDMARAEGIHTLRQNYLLVSALAILVAVSMQIVGILLITSMLIIPAAAGRSLGRSPEMMVIGSVSIALLSVGLGMYASYNWDIPAGPAIVAASAILFVLSYTPRMLRAQ